MATDYVETGFLGWKKYDGLGSYQRILTTTDTVAFVLLGLYSVALSHTQTQAWKIIRHAAARIHKPQTQLDYNDSLVLRLSQRDAIAIAARWANHQGRRPWLRQQNLSASRGIRQGVSEIPPWYGVLALMNLVIFLGAGFLMPYSFTSGTLETPTVLSNRRHCEENVKDIKDNLGKWSLTNFFELLQLTEHTYLDCDNHLGLSGLCSFPSGWEDNSIYEEFTDVNCPFFPEICDNRTGAFQIYRFDIAAQSIGINSASRLRHNHRLTCQPVHLNSFVHATPNSGSSTKAVISVKYHWATEEFGKFLSNFSEPLATLNKPGSGFDAQASSYYLQVLPKNYDYEEPFETRNLSFLHPAFWHDDGETFMILRKAGDTTYERPIDDPFFSSHWQIDDSGIFYPDYEATALLCIEQFMLYIIHENGTMSSMPWGARSDYLRYMLALIRSLHATPDQATQDSGDLDVLLPQLLSVSEYLRYMAGQPAFMESNSRVHGRVFEIDTREQWIREVRTWFMKAAYFSKIIVRSVPTSKVIPLNRFCGRILLREGDFTNIEYVPLLLTTLVLALLNFFGQSVVICYVDNISCEGMNKLTIFAANVSRAMVAKYLILKTKIGSTLTVAAIWPVVNRLGMLLSRVYCCDRRSLSSQQAGPQARTVFELDGLEEA